MSRAQERPAAPGAARAPGSETVVVHGNDVHVLLGTHAGSVERTHTPEVQR